MILSLVNFLSLRAAKRASPFIIDVDADVCHRRTALFQVMKPAIFPVMQTCVNGLHSIARLEAKRLAMSAAAAACIRAGDGRQCIAMSGLGFTIEGEHASYVPELAGGARLNREFA